MIACGRPIRIGPPRPDLIAVRAVRETRGAANIADQILACGVEIAVDVRAGDVSRRPRSAQE